MQKCKYLDDLGIPINEYGTNFMPDDDSREKDWSKERKEYGFDNRETWNLNRIFIEWIYTRVKMYKEYTCRIINTNFHKITYKDNEITQAEAMDKILELSKLCLLSDDDELIYGNLREICDIWKELLPLMWW